MERRLRQLSDILENDGVDKLLESLKNGSDFLEDVENGNSPLHVSATIENLDIVEFLSTSGVELNKLNKETLTPLHYAAKTGDKEISRWLLYYGADPTLPNNLGITADIMAFAQGHTAVGKMLAQMTTSRAEGFREQLFPSNKNPRIKLKLFGAPRSGKTTFSESFRSVGVSYYIRRKFKALSEFADKFSENDTPEYSIWDFSGFKSYYFLYDYFIGNTSCVHMIFYSLRDNPSTQRENVNFWLEFIHSRIPAHEGK
ncbi:unnamed protein product [Schistocephalus solidus]|uniref:ANK_REP_REGION domain-containing protein n=1 Tax=Schistocephalus solidus TaxID=70667 RepID=A0A183SXG4_SCHSO|nr:unnamed protein product [Schistocephalus solidus]